MKKILPLLLVFALSCDNAHIESDWEKIGLSGKVQKLVERTYRANMHEGQLVETEVLSINEYIYNEKGYVVQWNYSVPAYKYSEFYTYDENGNPSTVLISDPTDSSRSNCYLRLNSKNQIIEEKWLDEDGNMEFRYENTYNKKHQLIETKAYNNDDSLKSIRRFHYNAEGLQDSVKSYDSKNELQQYTVKSFQGKWLKSSKSYILSLDVPEHLAIINSSEFKETDEKGNWLRSVMTTENKRSNETVYRIIARDILYFQSKS